MRQNVFRSKFSFAAVGGGILFTQPPYNFQNAVFVDFASQNQQKQRFKKLSLAANATKEYSERTPFSLVLLRKTKENGVRSKLSLAAAGGTI